MIQAVRPFLVVSCLALYTLTVIGCGEKTPPLPPSVTAPPPPSEPTAAEDDHDHDHPDHGSRGGHLVEMNDGTKVEVTFADDIDMFTVYPESPDTVSKVEMITKVDANETTYEFEKQPTFDSIVFALTSPELSTAAKMGEGVDIQLVVTREEGALTGKFEHHQH